MGLALIAATVEDAVGQGLDVDFRPPIDLGVRNYLSRMNLGTCLEPYADVGLRPVQHRGVGGNLTELQRFDGDDGGEALAASVFNALRAKGRSIRDAQSFYKGIAEVVNNAVEHSGVGGGWAAMQIMPKLGGMITFAIADAGMGIEWSLRRRHDVAGPVQAIREAFRANVSGTGSVGRGQGLPDLLHRVERHRGRVRVWSGRAYGETTLRGIACTESSVHSPGTLIYAEFMPDQEVWP